MGDDIDLWLAGVAEKPLPGSMVGPTFACIIGKQFSNFRSGDRFWYENGGWPSSFTLEQLSEIRKIKMSRVLCDNSDDIDSIQVYAMVLPDHEINPRVPCKSGVLPRLDLSKWRDASFHSHPGGSFHSGRPFWIPSRSLQFRPAPHGFKSFPPVPNLLLLFHHHQLSSRSQAGKPSCLLL